MKRKISFFKIRLKNTQAKLKIDELDCVNKLKRRCTSKRNIHYTKLNSKRDLKVIFIVNNLLQLGS